MCKVVASKNVPISRNDSGASFTQELSPFAQSILSRVQDSWESLQKPRGESFWSFVTGFGKGLMPPHHIGNPSYVVLKSPMSECSLTHLFNILDGPKSIHTGYGR